jgi:hypothetical protein
LHCIKQLVQFLLLKASIVVLIIYVPACKKISWKKSSWVDQSIFGMMRRENHKLDCEVEDFELQKLWVTNCSGVIASFHQAAVITVIHSAAVITAA